MSQPGNNPLNPRNTSSTPPSELECIAFQAQMPERIGAGEDLQTNPHLLTCDRCRALVRDLEAIAEAARQLMPALAEPPDKLWEQIERAIAEEEG